MNYFAPALREVRRIFDRQINRFSLVIARRNLAKAEHELGLLGWQQADFEGEAKRHIEQLANVEREQAKLTNESAALAFAIGEAKSQRETQRERHEEARAQLEAQRESAAEPVDEAERHLASRRKIDVDFDKLIGELERELGEVRGLYNQLLTAEPRTPQIHDELVRLRDRTVEIPNAISDLRLKRVQAENDIRALEEKLAGCRPVLAAAEEELRKLRADFERADGALERKIAGLERGKRAIEKRNDDLESAKGNPYRQIGQILADNNIAPMNQPQALDAVKRGRKTVVRIASDIAASLEASGNEDREAMKKSWIVWAAALAGVIAAILLAIPQ